MFRVSVPAEMHILITGITGFAGSHMAEYALGQGAEVWGSVRRGSRTDNVTALLNRVHLVECDLRDGASIAVLVEKAAPERIFHLAAQTFVPASFDDPAETFTANVVPQINLLEAARKLCPDARILVVGSSEEYGKVAPEELPVSESN